MPHRKPRSGFPAKVDLIESLVDPRLSGARCAGKSPLFDAEIDGETAEDRSDRLTWARQLCTRCPVASACRTAGDEQQHPLGVWAGRTHGLPGNPGRPATNQESA